MNINQMVSILEIKIVPTAVIKLLRTMYESGSALLSTHKPNIASKTVAFYSPMYE